MRRLGLELSDAGIMAAAADPLRLLPIDGQDVESPGFALPEKKQLTVGRAAERKAHLFPRQVLNRFWDQLNTEPLQQPNPFAESHAEIAYDHVAHIWKRVKEQGNELLIAVPGFFTRDHLGLILGIARELSIPVKGFVSLAVAAASNRPPEGLLLHLDIHLHRSEVTYLKREDHLAQEDSVSAEGIGIRRFHKEWVNAIAEEFVRTTRFDPFHRAASEQELVDRLPVVLAQLQQNPAVVFEMTGGPKTYHVTLTRELFSRKSEPLFHEIYRLIEGMLEKHGKDEPTVILQLTRRLTRLPGFKEMLVGMDPVQILELELGAGALGALQFGDQQIDPGAGEGVPFFTSRPLLNTDRVFDVVGRPPPRESLRPTHLLYRNLAYPIAEHPLWISRESPANDSEIRIQSRSSGVFEKVFCSIELRGQDVLLTDCSTKGIFVDESRVEGSMVLKLGQLIRVGKSDEILQLIACVVDHET